jgi:hypothetical protein
VYFSKMDFKFAFMPSPPSQTEKVSYLKSKTNVLGKSNWGPTPPGLPLPYSLKFFPMEYGKKIFSDFHLKTGILFDLFKNKWIAFCDMLTQIFNTSYTELMFVLITDSCRLNKTSEVYGPICVRRMNQVRITEMIKQNEITITITITCLRV